MNPTPEGHETLHDGVPIADREAALAAGADGLADRTPLAQRTGLLIVIAGAMMTAGFTAIVLAWIGTSRSTILEEQVPYVVSGGLLGAALAIVGAIVYFAHWLTVLIRQTQENQIQQNRQHEALVQEMRLLRGAMTAQESTNGSARSTQRQRPLRGSARGS